MRFAPESTHVLPDVFHRIRHYGFLARGDRSDNIERCRKLIGEARSGLTAEAAGPAAANADAAPATEAVAPRNVCPDCGGLMRRIGVVRPYYCDTS